METTKAINGKELFLFLQKRFKQTPKEALESMKANNQDTTFLTSAEKEEIKYDYMTYAEIHNEVKEEINKGFPYVDNGIKTFDRYKQNLKATKKHIYSYNTRVAEINHVKREIRPLGWWSVTTSKHINYVGSEYGYEVQKIN